MYECVVAEVRMPRQTKGCVCMNVGFWKWEGQGGMARRTLESDARRLDVETNLDLPVIYFCTSMHQSISVYTNKVIYQYV